MKNHSNNTLFWKEFKQYERDLGKVRGVAFFPNDNSSFISIYDGVIEIFREFKTFRTILFTDEINKHNNLKKWVMSLAVNHTGKWLAVADEDGYIRLWNLDSTIRDFKLNQPQKKFKAHDSWIRSMAFIDKDRLISSSEDCSVKIWNICFLNGSINVQNLRIVKGYSNWIWSLIYSHDGNYLFSSHGDSKIRVWKNNHFDSPIKVLDSHSNIVRTMSITCDGKILATGSCDCLVKLWNIERLCNDNRNSGLQSIDLKGHKSWVRCVRSHPSKPHIIASCGDDTSIRLWDIRSQECYQILGESDSKKYLKDKKDFKRHTDPVRTICFSDDGKYLASGGGDKKIIVWKLIDNQSSDQPEYAFLDSKSFNDESSDSSDWVYSITFIMNRIIAAVGGKEIPVFKVTENNIDIEEENCNREFYPIKYLSSCKILKYDPKNKRIASGGTDDGIEFCLGGIYEGKSQKIHKGAIRAMAFSPDGKTLVTGGQDEHLYIWDTESKNLLKKKLLVKPPYINVEFNFVSGISSQEKESILKLMSGVSLCAERNRQSK